MSKPMQFLLRRAEDFLDRFLTETCGIDLSGVKSLEVHARGYAPGTQYAFKVNPGFSVLVRIGEMPSSSGEPTAMAWIETAMTDTPDVEVLRWSLSYNHALSASWRISLLGGRFLGTEAMIDLAQVREGQSTEDLIKSALGSGGILWNAITESFPNLEPLLARRSAAQTCH